MESRDTEPPDKGATDLWAGHLPEEEEDDLGVLSDDCVPVHAAASSSASGSGSGGWQKATRVKKNTPPKEPTLEQDQDATELPKSARGRIVIMEITSGTEKQRDQLLGGSVKLSALLRDSPFGIAGIENVTVNWKKKSVAILLKSKEQVPQLLQVLNLGDFEVLCSQPGSHIGVSGKIGPIVGDITAEEIQSCLCEREDQRGIRVIRLQKGSGKEKVTALSVRLIFPGETLPSFVYLGFQRFRVSLFVDRPMQCYKCQGFGHGSRQCGGREVCVVCAGPHMLKDCPKSEVKCVNCGGAHAASYGGCTQMKTAFQVEKVRAVKKLTYSEALAVVHQKKRTIGITLDKTDVVESQREDSGPSGPSHSQVMAGHPTQVSVGCQTAPVSSAGTQTSETVSRAEDAASAFSPDEKFCAVLIEMAGLMSATMSKKFRCVMASSLIKKHYGRVIDAGKIELNMSGDSSASLKGKKHKLDVLDDQETAVGAAPRQPGHEERLAVSSSIDEKRRKIRPSKSSVGVPEFEMDCESGVDGCQDGPCTTGNKRVDKHDKAKGGKNTSRNGSE